MMCGGTGRAERVQVNMLEGKMFVEFHAESREALEAWLKAEGMHFDWLVRIEWETRGQDYKLHIGRMIDVNRAARRPYTRTAST